MAQLVVIVDRIESERDSDRLRIGLSVLVSNSELLAYPDPMRVLQEFIDTLAKDPQRRALLVALGGPAPDEKAEMKIDTSKVPF